MKTLSIAVVLFSSLIGLTARAQLQTCIVPSPPAPPIPIQLIVSLPIDGGTQGCTAVSIVPGAVKQPTSFAIGNAKCATAVAIAQQAAAVDNGWNDGGAP